MPPDEDVLEDFGFNNVSFGRDRSYLLGLYGGLYSFGSVSSEDIHEWRVTGILAEKIKEFLFQDSRDPSGPYLDAEDRNKTARELQPQAKGHSYNLLAGMLRRCTPNPTEENWYSFGFVACRDQGEESMLLDLYQLLLTTSDGSFFYEIHNRRRGTIAPATFTRFWKAHESRTLIPLMDSKGLKELRSRNPFLEAFLSAPPMGPRPSVWDLKQFLEIRDPVDYPPQPCVSVDYGFWGPRVRSSFTKPV
ncbi:hypothetical protein T440DRAFT_520041 [Plenodomus tracheiphilus IPT5]|uniref:Uncharacterized protein n=1 Tax=Plenodomus tracheiphilus IPT5 TaxID=1408161 RepID=A0A6A7B1P9_9PLEO|nr:hypothetical protein T440DRAFT_520041 [Plenodomus tracheiphilus IPT5]